MSVFVTTSIRIDAPPALAWEVWRDLARWSEWTETINPAPPIPADPWRVGETVYMRPKVGVPVRFTAKIVAVDPGREVAWEGRSAGVVGRHVFRFEADGAGTIFHHEQRFSGPGMPLFHLIGGARRAEGVFEAYNADLAREVGRVAATRDPAADGARGV
ncbi:MAG: SRPBCC domain-containing protein [Myxococcales bacterium]|nr:SRPBCC domain-containing protein [Myxococcales bacterium]